MAENIASRRRNLLTCHHGAAGSPFGRMMTRKPSCGLCHQRFESRSPRATQEVSLLGIVIEAREIWNRRRFNLVRLIEMQPFRALLYKISFEWQQFCLACCRCLFASFRSAVLASASC